jgi:hydrogenase expression/formation protein HypC
MCLGVPGEIVSIEDNALEMRMGQVKFGELRRLVCLAFTPEAEIGDYVIVHAGYAISHMDEDQASQALELLAELDEVAEGRGESTTFTLT